MQSGKKSSDAEIGGGFCACTKTARVSDFPDEAPIIRFLDTRGLGEVAYDPSEDIGFCEGRAHLILAVIRAFDVDYGRWLDTILSKPSSHGSVAASEGRPELQ